MEEDTFDKGTQYSLQQEASTQTEWEGVTRRDGDVEFGDDKNKTEDENSYNNSNNN